MKHLTAIKRNKISAPMKYLMNYFKNGDRILDYGCGRGDDADRLNMEKYDPFYFPEMPTGEFDKIVCNYVLNVIEDESERCSVIRSIRGLLRKDGVAYVSVRNDRDKLNGTTKRGTWQGFIELPYERVKVTKGYIIYKIQA